ncbi:MAG: ABC transporter permease [Dehalococcoidia bacterium]|nr:ABC transporter permease [Dehalococcoidia bacterium]
MALPTFSRRSFRVWQRNRDVFLHLWRAETVPVFAEPIFILVAMGWGLGGYVGSVEGQSYLFFIGPGIVASYAMFSAIFECTYGTYVRMHHQRTFDAIIATPLNIEDVIAGEIFWAATRSLITTCAILIVIAAFGLITSPWAILTPLLGVLGGLMFGAISMAVTSIVPSIYSYNYFFTLFTTPMFFFSGVFFPLSSLPEVVQKAAWFLPLTPMVNMTRALVQGRFHPGLLLELLYVLAVTLVFFLLSLYGMRKRLIK